MLSQEGLVSSDANLASDVRAWNPFNDMTPFSQMSEDHIFGAEFDKIRRGSQSSKYDLTCKCSTGHPINVESILFSLNQGFPHPSSD